jgi:hypothetical protein
VIVSAVIVLAAGFILPLYSIPFGQAGHTTASLPETQWGLLFLGVAFLTLPLAGYGFYYRKLKRAGLLNMVVSAAALCVLTYVCVKAPELFRTTHALPFDESGLFTGFMGATPGLYLVWLGSIVMFFASLKTVGSQPVFRLGARFLRVTLYWGASKLKEHLFVDGGSVSVGAGLANMFTLPSPFDTLVLVKHKGGRTDQYWIGLTHQMDGQVSIGGKTMSVADYKKHQAANTAGVDYIRFKPGDSALIRFGDQHVTVEFSEPARTRSKKSIWAAFDERLASCMVFSLALQLCLILGVAIFHNPMDFEGTNKGDVKRLVTLQSKLEPKKKKDRMRKLKDKVKKAEEEKKLSMLERKLEEMKQEDELKDEEDKDPLLEEKKGIKRVVEDQMSKKTRSMYSDLKSDKSRKRLTSMSQPVSKDKIRSTGALAAINESGIRLVGYTSGEGDFSLDAAFQPTGDLAILSSIGDGGGGGGLGGADSDPFDLGSLGRSGGDYGSFDSSFGSTLAADGAAMRGNNLLAGRDFDDELGKKKLSSSVKNPKFKDKAVKITPSASFDMSGGGKLDKEVVKEYIRKQLAKIRWCYQMAFQKNPDLEGKLTVSFIISPTGSVMSAKVINSTLNDAELEGCVEKKIMTWRFPAPQGGGVVKVNYPFVLRKQ